MYLEYYGLREPPFSITPDPRYVFLSERHRDALAHLLYGIGKGGSGGFVQLTGEVGTGKTTLCRLLLEQLPEDTRVALVLNPKLSPVELIEAVCEELKLDIVGKRGGLKALTDTLNTYLLDAYAQGLRVVLILDEAQELSSDSLEQVRLLTNLETPTQKLLQIILLGQPELREMLAKPELRQLAQRITARYHLMPLDAAETDAYVRHRMAVAGCTRMPFSRLGLRTLYRRSSGIPRVINVVADRALMAGYVGEQETIGERLVDQAADEALPGHVRYRVRRYGPWAALLAAVLLGLGVYLWQQLRPAEVAAPLPVAVPIVEPPIDPGMVHLGERIPLVRDSELAAFGSLLARWQVDSNQVSVRDASRCAAVIVPGLNCLRGRATLDQIARFDRPLILILQKNTGQKDEAKVYSLLKGVGRTKLRLDLAGETIDLQRASLVSYWSGDFIALWRLPDFIPATMKLGDSSPAVGWVKDRLASLDGGATASVGPSLFDAALEQRVLKLQTSYGVKSDGIIGPETLLVLSALDDAGPHLARSLE